jgi:hypothetical protein
MTPVSAEARASSELKIMKLMKKQWWLALLCAAFGAVITVHAEDAVPKVENASPAQKQATAPTAYQGKVVVVDKTARTFTVEIEHQLYLFKLTAQTRLLRKDKPVLFKDLAPGQEITLVIQQEAGGPIEVVSVSIEKTGTPVEAAGSDGTNNGKKPTTNPGNGHGNGPPPTVSPYN